MPFQGTNTPLDDSGEFVGEPQNALTFDFITGLVWSTIPGTLYVDQGMTWDDEIFWDYTVDIPVVAEEGTPISVNMGAPLYRLRFEYDPADVDEDADPPQMFRMHVRGTASGFDGG